MLPENPHDKFFKEAFSRPSGLGRTELIAIFSRVSKKTNDSAMTAYEELINEGQQRAALKFIRGFWRLGIDAKTIAQALEMPLDEVQAIIKKISEETI